MKSLGFRERVFAQVSKFSSLNMSFNCFTNLKRRMSSAVTALGFPASSNKVFLIFINLYILSKLILAMLPGVKNACLSSIYVWYKSTS
jgi:hypothetical protein